MKILPLIMWSALILLFFGILFFIPPETVGFAADIDTGARSVMGTALVTAGVLALLAIANQVVVEDTEARKRGRPKLVERFSELDTTASTRPQELKDAILDNLNYLRKKENKHELKMDGEIGKYGSKDVVSAIDMMYGLSGDMEDRIEFYLERSTGAGSAVGYVIDKAVIEILNTYKRIDEKANRYRGKFFQK